MRLLGLLIASLSLPTLSAAVILSTHFSNNVQWLQQQGHAGGWMSCKASSVPGYCIVPKERAELLCLAHPDCNYVGTTTNAGWNAAFPNSAQLGVFAGREVNDEWTTRIAQKHTGTSYVKWPVERNKIATVNLGDACAAYTVSPGYCVVKAVDAVEICRNRVPGCKYISYTTNQGWNDAFPEHLQLAGANPNGFELADNTEWTSVYVPPMYPQANCAASMVRPSTTGTCKPAYILNEFLPSTRMYADCECTTSWGSTQSYTVSCQDNGIWNDVAPTSCGAKKTGGPVSQSIDADGNLIVPEEATTTSSTNTVMIVAIVVPVAVVSLVLAIVGVIVWRRRAQKQNDIAAITADTQATAV